MKDLELDRSERSKHDPQPANNLSEDLLFEIDANNFKHDLLDPSVDLLSFILVRYRRKSSVDQNGNSRA